MSKFPVRRNVGEASQFSLLLLRAAGWFFPLTTFEWGLTRAAVLGALLLGWISGRARLVTSTSALAMVAGREGLSISARGEEHVPWSSVLAVEVWQRWNYVDCLAVHYLSRGRWRAATCWARFARGALLEFVQSCADGVSGTAPRDTIAVPGLRDREVWGPLVRRFLTDVSVTAGVGFAYGLAPRAFVLGLLTASVATVLDASRYPLQSLRLISEQGVWWRASRQGRRRLVTIPRSLRAWVRALGDHEYRARRR